MTPAEPTRDDHPGARPAALFNEAQKRGLLFGFLDLHRRLDEMEAWLTAAGEPSLLAQHVNDLSPVEARVVRDYFARLRSLLPDRLREWDIRPDVRRTSLRWALQVGMNFLHVAVAELGPGKLTGYGPLAAAGRAQALQAQQELGRLIDRIGAYLRQGTGRDLGGRLARLEAASGGGGLGVLDRVITRRGLTEFRPLLDQVVQRLESPQFEVAVFGRVSSGKSSLLNHLAGLDVLPVGVTPVTAVPTRLVRGDRPAATVFIAETGARAIDVEELRAYAAEEGNPGNSKHVTGILVQVPSPRLREGVVLVDTPGVGSLARAGSAETYAYLPQCDLGVVLIDAASTLSPEDLDLLRLLSEAGVPAQVVLSKADLLTPADRDRAAAYVREQVRRELGLDLAVHPVSTVGAAEALLTRWFEAEIEPLLVQHRALAAATLRRKVAHLRESVVAALETMLARRRGGAPDGRVLVVGESARRLLDEADEAIRQAQAACRGWTADEPALLEVILNDAAEAVVAPAGVPAADAPVPSAVQGVLAQRDQAAHGLVTGLRRDLTRSLEGLRQEAPLVPAEAAPAGDLTFRGLPVPDLRPLGARLRAARPWWAALLPRPLAVWLTRRRLARRLGPGLRELVELHDRQLQAWLRSALGQVVELYEARAEVFREQARRAADGGDAGPVSGEAQELEADLRELRRLAPEAETVDATSPDGVGHPSA